MNKKAIFLIKKLNLKKHPEGGYYFEIYRSKEKIKKNNLKKRYNGNRAFSTSIYFLLCNNGFSSFHKLHSDEIWHFYDGDAVIIYLINSKGIIKKVKIGRNIQNGEIYQIVIKAGTWMAAKTIKNKSFSLIGCTSSPGFEYNDFELGVRKDLIKKFPKHKKIIIKFTKL